MSFSEELRNLMGHNKYAFERSHVEITIIQVVESLEKELDETRGENTRLRMENQALSEKNLSIASELLQKREQVDTLKTRCEGLTACVNTLRKLIPDND